MMKDFLGNHFNAKTLDFFKFDHGGSLKKYIIKITMHSSCEIEYFVETHLCKLCAILRLRVLRVVCPHY